MFSLSRAITQIDYTGVQSALNLSYEYDAVGNVKTAKQNGSIVAQYEYDEQNQLVSEVLPQQNLKYEYVYDTCFNLRQVKTYQNGSETPTITEYGYTDADWADLMTRYNGQAITYDAIGNPLTYNNGTAWTFTWQGTHDLATATANGKSISYHYDMDGVRDSKTINGVKHEYITQGGNVTLERWNDGEAKSLEFIYDNGGAPYSVIYTHGSTSETYYYILNQQGDVIRIVDGNGRTAAEYVYNGWGEILSTQQATGTTIGTLNPIRYRGYYYDSELNMYYLQSRYYDPVVKRMLSADDESLTASATLNNNNLFVYCDNDPVDREDGSGEFWHIVAGALISAGIELLSECLAGEEIDREAIVLAGFSGGVSAAFGGLTALASNKAAEVAIEVGVGFGSEMAAYAFSTESKSTSSSVKGKAGQALVDSLASTTLSRSMKPVGKYIAKRTGKALSKISKKPSSASKHSSKSKQGKQKKFSLKKFCLKYNKEIRDHVSALTVNIARNWKKTRTNIRKKWKAYLNWRKR